MGIFRTNDPNLFDDIDGIIIDETAPPPSIQGVASNTAILVGLFQRGIQELKQVTSIGEFHELFGKSSFSGNKQLKNKKFGRLKIIRVIASDAVLATKTFDASATPTLKFDAISKGAYGNNLKVTIETGSVSGKKYTIEDTNSNAVLSSEVFDNIAIADIVASTFSSSQLVVVTVVDTGADPDDTVATALATGSDGAVADSDYESALVLAEQERAGNVVFFDVYTTARNVFLKTHVADTQDKMVIVCGDPGDDRATAITDAALNRDTDGRIIYAWPYIKTTIDGAIELVAPGSWAASIFSQTSPHIALSFTENSKFLGGIVDLEFKENRAGYIALDEAGIMAFEQDLDIGFLIKNAVTTQILSSSKKTILRRRMADFLTDSIALFLKNYQNDVNSTAKRNEIKAQIVDFDQRLIRDGILPGEQDVKDGSPVLIDTESLNTDSVIAAGKFKILYKRRIFSSMRYIILQAEIGESVIVTDIG